jgi:hypothetical protein
MKKGISLAIYMWSGEYVDNLSLTHISTRFTYAGVSQKFDSINRIYTEFSLGYTSKEIHILPVTCSRKITFIMSKFPAGFFLSVKQYLVQTRRIL